MDTIMVSDSIGALRNVYAEDVLAFLKENAGWDGIFWTGAEVRNEADRFRDVKYIFTTWGFPTFSQEEIGCIFPSLQCVFYAAGTVQYFARPFLQRGIKVYSAWAANAVAVAEYTAAQITLAGKGFFAASRLQSRGDTQAAKEQSGHYLGNFETNIGIIGAGMIGKRVIRELMHRNLNVLVYDPFLPDDTATELGVRKCDLDYLFENCFVVSNHLADNAQTKAMLTGKQFEKMPAYATFINTGRGAQVVEEDLIAVLTKRKDLTAVLDVTDPEPPLPDSPFYALDNCVLTPHIAGSVGNEVHRMSVYMKEEYVRYIGNEQCLYEVTEPMLRTMA